MYTRNIKVNISFLSTNFAPETVIKPSVSAYLPKSLRKMFLWRCLNRTRNRDAEENVSTYPPAVYKGFTLYYLNEALVFNIKTNAFVLLFFPFVHVHLQSQKIFVPYWVNLNLWQVRATRETVTLSILSSNVIKRRMLLSNPWATVWFLQLFRISYIPGKPLYLTG